MIGINRRIIICIISWLYGFHPDTIIYEKRNSLKWGIEFELGIGISWWEREISSYAIENKYIIFKFLADRSLNIYFF